MIKYKQFSPPVTLPAQTTAKKHYTKPEFQVIPLNMESPLLSGSGSQPIQSPINPVTPGGLW